MECDLFDYLIRQDEERRGYRDPERLGGLQVDNQRKCRRLLHRQVARPGTFETRVHKELDVVTAHLGLPFGSNRICVASSVR